MISLSQLAVTDMSARELIDRTAAGTGTADPTRRHDVRVLDVFGRAASVRVDATGWVDYLHLIQTPTGWKIINVLWERREATPSTPRTPAAAAARP
jgi:Putative lumazine-binding